MELEETSLVLTVGVIWAAWYWERRKQDRTVKPPECSLRMLPGNLRTHCAAVCLLVGVSSFAQAPRLAFSDPAAPPFIVRLQRIQSDKNVCALVRGDGLFHVESETTNHFEVSEGTLDDAELANLKAALSNSELTALSQKKITSPLVMTEKDEFLLSILRSPFTQDLIFRDRESRKPFDSFISPLLHWIDTLQHYPHTSLSEFQGRHNCFPPKKLEFSRRREVQPSGEAPSVPIGSGKNDSLSHDSAAVPTGIQKTVFIIRWDVNRIAQGTVHDTCIVVYPSGLYHMEKSSQGFNEKLKLRAFEDTLRNADLEQLESLLNEPKLKSSTHRNLAEGKVFREGEMTTLDVSREGRVQQLNFASYFGVPGWVSNVSSGTDPEERIVSPLRKWLEAHVKAKKEVPLQNAGPTHCVPQP